METSCGKKNKNLKREKRGRQLLFCHLQKRLLQKKIHTPIIHHKQLVILDRVY